MRQLVWIAAVCVCAAAMSVVALAVITRTDNLEDVPNTGYRHIDGTLAIVDREGKDPRFRYQAEVKPDGKPVTRGSVSYSFTGAEHLSFWIYSPTGTLAVKSAGDSMDLGGYGLGEAQPVFPVRTDPADGKLYVMDDSGKWFVRENRIPGSAGASLIPAAIEVDPQRLVYYGVNLYYGTASGERIPVDEARITRAKSTDMIFVDDAAVWTEEITCEMPPGAVRVWIELNDIGNSAVIPDVRNSLAWVEFSGEEFSWGPPETSGPPTSSLPEDPPESSKGEPSKTPAPGSESSGQRGETSKAGGRRRAAGGFDSGLFYSDMIGFPGGRPEDGAQRGEESAPAEPQPAGGLQNYEEAERLPPPEGGPSEPESSEETAGAYVPAPAETPVPAAVI
ncbi:MAG: hypothetical protein LBU86_02245, partial [Oscillospiraceae bacterium]|nr:hypothetical protein [Oscillospiraceae bacterium]